MDISMFVGLTISIVVGISIGTFFAYLLVWNHRRQALRRGLDTGVAFCIEFYKKLFYKICDDPEVAESLISDTIVPFEEAYQKIRKK